MSVIRNSHWMLAIVVMAVCVPIAHGQHFQPFNPPPLTTDFQFFAPADIDTYGGGPGLRTGWYVAMDKVYMNVSRPDDQRILRPFENPPPEELRSRTTGDFTWGTKFDIGYVDDFGKGWFFNATHIDGPNINEVARIERIDRVNGGAPPILPDRDDDDRNTDSRDYFLRNSINVADLSGVELNRTWRLKRLHNGGTLEPFVGFRYVKFIDFHRRDAYERFDANGLPIPPTAPQALQTTAVTERFTRKESGFTNDLVGGQVGIRWQKPLRRWNFYGDVKMFGFQNFQNWDQNTRTEQTEYTAIGTAPPTTVLYQENSAAANAAEFVWGGEVEIEAAFEVTRDIALRGGFQSMYFGQGMGRGDIPNRNDEDVFMFGVTFGATLNR